MQYKSIELYEISIKKFLLFFMNFQNLLILNFRTLIQNFRDQSSIRADMFELQLERKYVKSFHPKKTQQ